MISDQRRDGLAGRVPAVRRHTTVTAGECGVSHARGDYLMFMDDDNVAKPHEIATLVAVAQRTKADIVTSFCDVFETDSTLEDNAPFLWIYLETMVQRDRARPCRKRRRDLSSDADSMIDSLYHQGHSFTMRRSFDAQTHSQSS